MGLFDFFKKAQKNYEQKTEERNKKIEEINRKLENQLEEKKALLSQKKEAILSHNSNQNSNIRVEFTEEIFAKNLRYYMVQNGKSRKEVTEAIGVSYYTFTDWVNGKKYPRMDKVEKLANYFGILKSDLIEEKSISKNLVETEEKHVEMLSNTEFVALYEDFKKLNEEDKNIVVELVKAFASKTATTKDA